LWLDDGHKTYKKTEIKLSVKVIYSATRRRLSQYKSLFLQLKWPKIAGGIKIYTELGRGSMGLEGYIRSKVGILLP